MSDDTTPEQREAPIDAAVVERVAESGGVETDELANALVVLNASLVGRHSTYEAECDYVTVDGRRAYRVDANEWESLAAGFDGELAAAVAEAHTRQARLLVDAAVADVRFDGDAAGVVVGVDTAEEMT